MASKLNPTSVVVTFKLDQSKFREIGKEMQECLLSMGYAISTQAKINAPVLTSALRNSIRVEPDDDGVLIRAGGTIVQDPKTGQNKRIAYAMVREKVNRAHPEKAHYMENAFNSITAGDYISKYFKGVLK